MDAAECCCSGVACPVFWFGPTTATGDANLASRIAEQGRAVLCFGAGMAAAEMRAVLDALPPRTAYAAIVVGAGDGLDDYSELIDADRIFYLSRGDLGQRDLDRLIAAAARSLCSEQHASSPTIAPNTLRRLALAQNLGELADAACAAAAKAANAERTRCVLFDRAQQMLWVPSGRRDADTDQSAAVGLTSFILRTGAAVCLPHAGDDPRFDRSLDDPDGDAGDRFVGAVVRSSRGEGMAVLLALRDAGAAPFEPADVAALQSVAGHVAPYLEPWLPGEPQPAESPFRERALREIDLPIAAGPEPLRLEPKWSRRLSLLVLATLLAALLAAVLVPQLRGGSSQLPGIESGRRAR